MPVFCGCQWVPVALFLGLSCLVRRSLRLKRGCHVVPPRNDRDRCGLSRGVVAFGLVVLVRVVRVVLLGVLALFYIGYQRLLGGR